jgi:hypothetical protein
MLFRARRASDGMKYGHWLSFMDLQSIATSGVRRSPDPPPCSQDMINHRFPGQLGSAGEGTPLYE